MFDNIVGSVLSNVLGGSDGEGQQKAMSIITNLIASQGGVQGVLGKLQSGGMGDVLQSWLGSGDNQTVSAQQLDDALGSNEIAQAAQQAGVEDSGEASNLLSEYLPKVIDMLSPNGEVEDSTSNDLLSKGLESVLGSFFK